MQTTRDPVSEPLHVPTSAVLAQLVADMPDDQVNLTWFMDRLENRSFGLVLLLVALIGLIPGIATVATILMPFLALQMLCGWEHPKLPAFVQKRTISSARFSRNISRLIPLFRRIEIFVRPRWRTPSEATKRFVGGLVLILAITTLAPFPFYQVPTLAIIVIAFAYLEADGLLLCVSLFAAALSFLFTAGSVFATIKAIGFIGRLFSMI
jgi:hypothetical protein